MSGISLEDLLRRLESVEKLLFKSPTRKGERSNRPNASSNEYGLVERIERLEKHASGEASYKKPCDRCGDIRQIVFSGMMIPCPDCSPTELEILVETIQDLSKTSE